MKENPPSGPAAAFSTMACALLSVTLFLSGAALAKDDGDVQTSNYAKQAISLSYNESGDGLPLFGTLNGTVTELDTINSTIALNRTNAELGCSSGFMNIKLKFQRPFYGIVYADFDRNSACKITGNGKLEDTIQLPLKGCGTLQSPARVFTNNIVVRFHPGLEIDGDEVITVICRYPTPVVLPPAIPAPVIAPIEDPVPSFTPLREFEILLIICAIIFLALMLLGIGCSYYCLKKRNIKVVRMKPPSSLGSDVTKVSEPTSMFDGLKIPRAVAVEASGSSEMTESIREDFHSDVQSVESEEEYTSAYSDKSCILPAGAVIAQLHAPPHPDFDVRMLVKDRGEMVFTPTAMSTTSSDTETILNAQEQYLTTILEKTETNTLETLERFRKAQANRGPPPVHARINIKNKVMSDTSEVESVSDGTEMFSEQELELETKQMKHYSVEGTSRQQQQQQSGRNATRSNKHHGQRNYYDERTQVIRHDEMAAESYQMHSTTAEFETARREASSAIANAAATAGGRYITTGTIKHSPKSHHEVELITPVIQKRPTGTEESTAFVSSSSMKRNFASNNFDVLIRVIDEPTSIFAASTTDHRDEVESVFTEDERSAIKQVLLEDISVMRSLKETNRRESISILKDHEYIKEVVEPKKWDVLIRILTSTERFIPDNEGDDVTSESNYALSRRTSAYSHEGATANLAFEHDEISAPALVAGVSSRAQQQGAASVTTVDRRSSGALSAADRSATEITEYHAYNVQRSEVSSFDTWKRQK